MPESPQARGAAIEGDDRHRPRQPRRTLISALAAVFLVMPVAIALGAVVSNALS